MPRVFICNDQADYFYYPLNPNGTENTTVQHGVCLAGAGQWVEYAAAPVQPEPPLAGVTPEQAAVQIAIIGVGALSAFKGFAIGLMR